MKTENNCCDKCHVELDEYEGFCPEYSDTDKQFLVSEKMEQLKIAIICDNCFCELSKVDLEMPEGEIDDPFDFDIDQAIEFESEMNKQQGIKILTKD